MKMSILSYFESQRSKGEHKLMIREICDHLAISRDWGTDREVVQGALASLAHDGKIDRDGHGWKLV